MNTALLRPAANDNMPFEAEFKLPKLFLDTYSGGLLDWAKNIMKGNVLTIDLLGYPDGSILSDKFQGQVKLRCDAFGHPVTKKLKFVVAPADEEQLERVRKHCEELPSILAAHHAKEQAAAAARPKVARWVFDGTVPEYFVMRYQTELRQWAANLKKIGSTKSIVLREGSLADLSPDETLGAELVQVKLRCKVEMRNGSDEVQIVVSALDGEQERRIRKHCEKMQRNKIPAGAVLVEPERPYVPFMPKIDK